MRAKLFLILTLSFIVSVVFSNEIFCQNSRSVSIDTAAVKRNGIYLETYLIRHDFSSGWVSLNYERSLGKKNNMMIRVGVYPDFNTCLSLPLTYSFCSPAKGKHHFEYGFGLVFRLEFYEGNVYKDVPAIMFPLMYRFQNSSGFFIRAGINLFYSWPTLPSPSISIGYKIK